MKNEDVKAEYPKMLYLGADPSDKWVIVEDEAAHAEANRDGYSEPGDNTKKPKAKAK